VTGAVAHGMPADAAFFSLQKHGAGRGTALFNLCNIALGSGVLGFPAVYAQAGWLYATAFIAVFALLGAFSNTIMIRSASWYRVVSFHSVVREALGRRAGHATALAMVVYSFGGCAAFLVIIGDFLSPACAHARSAAGWQAAAVGDADLCSRNFLILAAGVAVVLPLSLRPTVTALGRAGSFAILGICYLAAAVLWRGFGSYADRGFRPPPGMQAVVGSAAGLVGPVGTVAWSFAVMLGIPR
jgi:amino acid permease